MIYQEIYARGCEALKEAEIEEAALDARLLLEYVCNTTRNDLLVHGERPVTDAEQEQYLALIERRKQRIPLQQLTGVQEFMGLEFLVNEHVLIPRQDTEILVEEVLKELHDGMRVLDMCTGSGCIILSLLHYTNDCEGVGVDVSVEALKVANANALRMSKGAPERVTFIQSNLFENVTGQYEFIVSNPPYIKSAVIDTLLPEVRDYEPRLALDGTEDGLFFYRKIVEEGREFLVKGGRLYFEIGYDQAEAVSELLQAAGFKEIQVVKDYAGLDRVVYGTYIS